MVEVPEDVAGPVVAVEAQRSAPDLGVHVPEPAAGRLGLGEPVRRRLVDVPEQRCGGVEERVVHVGVARGHAAQERRRGGVVAHGDAPLARTLQSLVGLSSRSDGVHPTGPVPRNSTLRAPRP